MPQSSKNVFLVEEKIPAAVGKTPRSLAHATKPRQGGGEMGGKGPQGPKDGGRTTHKAQKRAKEEPQGRHPKGSRPPRSH